MDMRTKEFNAFLSCL